MTTSGRRWAPAGAGITAAAAFAALCVPRLDRSYVYDESVTVGFFVRQDSWWEAVTSQHGFNNHPLLTAIDWLLNRAGGTTEAWLRLPSLLAGAATVFLLVWWSYQRWGPLAATGAAALTVANPMLVDQSTQARGYALSALFAAASTLVLVDRRHRLHESRTRLAYAALVALGLLAHLYTALVVIGHGIHVLVRHRERVAAWLRAAVLGGLLASPIYLAMLPMMLESTRAGEGVFRSDFPIEAASELFGGVLPGLLGLALLAALIVTTPGARAPALGAGAIVAVLWLVVRPLNFFPRFVVTVTVLAALLGACAVARDRRWLVAVAVVGLAGLPATFDMLDESPDLRLVADTAQQARAAGSSVCVDGYYWEAYIAYAGIPPADVAPDCDVVITRVDDVRQHEHAAAIPGTDETCLVADPVTLSRLGFDPGSCPSAPASGRR